MQHSVWVSAYPAPMRVVGGGCSRVGGKQEGDDISGMRTSASPWAVHVGIMDPARVETFK